MFSSTNEESFWPVAIFSCLSGSLVSHMDASHMPAGQPFRLVDKADVQPTVLIPHLKEYAFVCNRGNMYILPASRF